MVEVHGESLTPSGRSPNEFALTGTTNTTSRSIQDESLEMSRRKRYQDFTTEREIPTVSSLGYLDPEEAIDLHLVFDLVTRRVADPPSDPKERLAVQRTVAAGLQLFGLGTGHFAQVWAASDGNTSTDSLTGALYQTDRAEDQRLSRTLWLSRARLLRLPLAWDHVLEGHPLLAEMPFQEDRMEIVSIADAVIASARQSIDITHSIDRLLARIYGAPDPLPPVTYIQLAQSCPWAAHLSELYSWADFGLTGSECEM